MKRSLSFVFVSLIILVCVSVTVAAFEIVLPDDDFEDEVVYATGDVNGDGKVDTTDLSALSRFFSGGQVSVDGNADVNGDGTLTINDQTMLRRIFSGAAF